MNPDELTAAELKRIGGRERRKYLKADPLTAKKMVHDTRKAWVTPEATTFMTMIVGFIMTAPVGIASMIGQPITLDMLPGFILGALLIGIATIGIGISRIQTYVRDCIRYRGYLDDER